MTDRSQGALWRIAVAVLAGLAILLALVQLERGRGSSLHRPLEIGTIPATLRHLPGVEKAPVVVIAHGFAGSRQFMEGFAQTLAAAGYVVLSYDLAGHGRNRVPMSGDVTQVSGTTERLVAEARRVIEAARALPQAGGGLAVVGHSMATDVMIRAAQGQDVDAVVAVSMYSEAITPEFPARLLAVSGAYEPHLRAAALRALHQVDPAAKEGETARAPGVIRRAVAAPGVEHLGVLYSTTTLRETRAWLDAAFDRAGSGSAAAPVWRHGPWVALLLAGIVALAWPLAGLLPGQSAQPPARPWQLALAVGIPALAAPLAGAGVGLGLGSGATLPLMAGNAMALHLAVYGGLQLAILWRLGLRFGPGRTWHAVFLLIWGLGVFGLALDRYGGSFVPHPGRWGAMAALLPGALLFALGDQLATAGGRAPLWQRGVVRLGALVSVGLAGTMQFSGLLLALLALPILTLAWVVFGPMARWLGRRSGGLAAGLGLGVILAWSIGATFPMYLP